MSRGEGVERKWTGADAGRHYQGGRFASARARERDPRLVGALLDDLALPPRARILDAPSGTGRLAAALAARGWRVALDVSPTMLAQDAGTRRAQGSVFALPFPDRTFDAVVSCRFLHHLAGDDDLARAAGELARVSRAWVIASFWDAASWPAWRVRAGWKRGEGPLGRQAVAREAIERAFARSGARVLRYRSTLRFVSQQTFALVRVERTA